MCVENCEECKKNAIDFNSEIMKIAQKSKNQYYKALDSINPSDPELLPIRNGFLRAIADCDMMMKEK